MLQRPIPRSQNIDQLRDEVNQAKKLPFRSRIYRILNYSIFHPNEKTILGMFWDDDYHFFCNSKISSEFLGLKDNSMNTNLRTYGFVIDDSYKTSDFLDKYGSLPQANRWKRRYHFMKTFNRNSSETEILNLPRPAKELSENIPYAPVNIQYSEETPKITEFFQRHPEFADDVKEIRRRIDSTDKNWKNLLLEAAIDDWYHIIQKINSETVEADDISSIAVDECEEAIPENAKQIIFSNIKHLLQENSGFSQTTISVQFTSFFKLFLHFGRLSRMALRVKDVSYIEPPVQTDQIEPDYFFSFSQTGFSQSQHLNDGWCFPDWFIPTTDRDTVMRHFSNSTFNDWCVKFSSVPTRFTFVRKVPLKNELVTTHIDFYPISDHESYTFKVEGSDQFYSSLPVLLSEALNVNVDQVTRRCMNGPEFVVRNK